MKNKSLKYKIYIFIVVVIGWLITGSIGFNLYKKSSARNWEKTIGTIVEIAILHQTYEQAGTRHVYPARVKYEYIVGGKTYIGRQIVTNSSKMQSEERARNELKRLGIQRNAQVPIHYDKTSPTESLLNDEETSNTSTTWIILLLFLCGSIAGTLMLFKNQH